MAVSRAGPIAGAACLFGRGGAAGNAVVGAGITLLALLAALPFQFVGFLRARNYGLSVQSVPGWLWDWLLSTLLTMLALAAAGGARRSPDPQARADLVAGLRRLSDRAGDRLPGARAGRDRAVVRGLHESAAGRAAK